MNHFSSRRQKLAQSSLAKQIRNGEVLEEGQ